MLTQPLTAKSRVNPAKCSFHTTTSLVLPVVTLCSCSREQLPVTGQAALLPSPTATPRCQSLL